MVKEIQTINIKQLGETIADDAYRENKDKLNIDHIYKDITYFLHDTIKEDIAYFAFKYLKEHNIKVKE